VKFIRQIAAPLLLLAGTIGLVILGFATNQTGFVGFALLCLWPLCFGISAWVFRGLKDTYQIVPKGQIKRNQQPQAFN
jgi:hypothetical protein